MDVTNLFFSQSSQQHDETSSNQLFKVEKPEGDPWFFFPPPSFPQIESSRTICHFHSCILTLSSFTTTYPGPVHHPLLAGPWQSSFYPDPFWSLWHTSARVVPKKYKSDLAILQLKTHQSSVTLVTLRITSRCGPWRPLKSHCMPCTLFYIFSGHAHLL